MRIDQSTSLRWILAVIALLSGLVGAVQLALAAGPHAGDAGQPTPVPINDVVEAIVNFVLFAALLYWFGRGPVKRYFEGRSQTIATDLDQAAQILRQAEEKLADHIYRLERLDQDREEILERYRKEAEAEKDLILQSARREVERIRKEAKAVVEHETELARREIQKRIVDRAVELATSVIEKKLDDQVNRRLLEEFSDSLSALRSHVDGQTP